MKHPILLVEDSDEDYAVVKRALSGVALEVGLQRCTKGDDALDYLYQRGTFVTALRPALILLDLNLPGADGREVLARIKSDAELKVIPVIIVTTSSNPRDVETCYGYGVNAYHIKSVNYPAFKLELQRMINYWLTDCLLPASVEDAR
jgi:CheY-like chemotaxis protein